MDMSLTSGDRAGDGGGGACGAEVARELFVEACDFGAQLGDLFAVCAYLLAQRVDGGSLLRWHARRSVSPRLAEPVDLGEQLGLLVEPGARYAGGGGNAAHSDRLAASGERA